jgi:hypothetical protein
VPTRTYKLKAHAEHLLDQFLGLRAKFAVLEPMLFDRAVIDSWASGRRAHGFRTLTNMMLHACILDIAKVALDKNKRTPSVAQLVAALAETGVVEQLREEFAIWRLAPTSGDDPAVLELLRAMEMREEETRRAQFDDLVTAVRADWEELLASPALASFAVMRDKLIAHSELWHDGTKYRPLDVSSLRLKFGGLRIVIQRLQVLIDQLTLIYRNSSFDFAMLDEQVKQNSKELWSPAA